jgi:hypothetical protein
MEHIRRVIAIGIVVALGAAAAQAQTPGQEPTQQQQQQQQQQQPFGTQGFGTQGMADASLQMALNELRQMQSRIGQIISMLEGYTQTDDRLGRIEQDARSAALRAAARDFRGLQAGLQDAERRDQTAAQIAGIRRDLTRGFAGATGEARQQWTEFQQELAEFEEQVRAGTEDVTPRFDAIMQRFDEQLDADWQTFDHQARQRQLMTVGAELRGLRTDIDARRDWESVAERISGIRADFERMYQGVADAERERFEAFGQELQTFEQQVRTGADQAPQAYQELVQRFEREFQQQ